MRNEVEHKSQLVKYYKIERKNLIKYITIPTMNLSKIDRLRNDLAIEYMKELLPLEIILEILKYVRCGRI